MKFLAILICSLTLLTASSYEKKVEVRLCGLIGQREMAKFYGDVRSMDSFEKKIESYKFRHGIENFDEDSCRTGGYYPVGPNYGPYPPAYPPYYQDGYDRYDRYERGYDDYNYERGYRRGYKDGNRDYRLNR